MKIFWCEQSGIIEDRSLLIKNLQKAGIGYSRLNWKFGKEDPFCNIQAKQQKISWSKGRELLYESVREKLNHGDYIVFVDDDISFTGNNAGHALISMKEFLQKYQPVCAVANSENWHFSKLQKFLQKIIKRKQFKVFISDLELQIFRVDFADAVFPVVFDGGQGTLWYPYFVNNFISGAGALCISNVSIANSRHNEQGFYGGEYNKASDIIWKSCSRLMPSYAYLISKFIGFYRTVKLLNLIYYFRPANKARHKPENISSKSLRDLIVSRIDVPA